MEVFADQITAAGQKGGRHGQERNQEVRFGPERGCDRRCLVRGDPAL